MESLVDINTCESSPSPDIYIYILQHTYFKNYLQVIDPVAPRYTALAANNRLVNVRVLDSTIDHWKSVSLHPKNVCLLCYV